MEKRARIGEFRKGQKGYALVWVLVVLIVAGMLLIPLLLLMSAGLKSSDIREESTQRFYAADAGIEDGFYNVLHDIGLPANVGEEVEYPPFQLNDCTVDVTIYKAEEGTYRITATSTDNESSQSTTIESYVSKGPGGPLQFFDYAIASLASDLNMVGSTVVTSSPEENEGDVYANGKIRLTGSATIYGDAIATGPIQTVGSATITGEEIEYLDPPAGLPFIAGSTRNGRAVPG